MSIINCKCVNGLFENYDYNNTLIKKNIFKSHNKMDNAWIKIDNNVYSLLKNDTELLNIFKDYYSLDVKDYILNSELFKDIKKRIIILDKLKKRKIGILTN